MSDVPKIVQDRLRAAAPREDHPAADVLTAFAEQALPGSERDGVLRHLARCGDCREIVALSIPPSVQAEAQLEAARDGMFVRRTADQSRSWFAWPDLRWAAVAASVIVVASVLLLRPVKQTGVSDTELAPAESKVQAPSDDHAAKSVPPPATQPARSTEATPPAKSDAALFRKAQEPVRARNEVVAPPASLADKKRVGSPQNETRHQSSIAKLAAPTPGAPEANAPAAAVSSEQVSKSDESLAASGAAVETQAVAVQGGLVTRNEVAALPIEKAKPAAKDEAQTKSRGRESSAQKKLAAGAAESDPVLRFKEQRAKLSEDVRRDNTVVQWRLTEGRLERSLDAQATWQTALQLQSPVLAYGVRDSDVWAGGQAGALFHSSDGGTSWARVHPSTTAEALVSDIIAIDVRSSDEIVLITSRHQTWTTVDAGKTWAEK